MAVVLHVLVHFRHHVLAMLFMIGVLLTSSLRVMLMLALGI